MQGLVHILEWIAIASKDAALSAGSYSGNGIALCARVTQSGTTLNTLQERPLPK